MRGRVHTGSAGRYVWRHQNDRAVRQPLPQKAGPDQQRGRALAEDDGVRDDHPPHRGIPRRAGLQDRFHCAQRSLPDGGEAAVRRPVRLLRIPPWRRGRRHRERRAHQPKIQQGQRHPGHLQLPGLLAGRYHRLWRQRQRLADDGRCRHQRLHGQRLRQPEKTL